MKCLTQYETSYLGFSYYEKHVIILPKVYEITSGTLLCSILLDFGLMSITLDLAEQWIFVGAGNGKIHQIDLQSKVRSCTTGVIIICTAYSGAPP